MTIVNGSRRDRRAWSASGVPGVGDRAQRATVSLSWRPARTAHFAVSSALLLLASPALEVTSVGLKDELVGTFELVALESRRSDGVITRPYGEQPFGMFMFDSSGRYSVQLADPDRRRDQFWRCSAFMSSMTTGVRSS